MAVSGVKTNNLMIDAKQDNISKKVAQGQNLNNTI
jgi:hypothetical protein